MSGNNRLFMAGRVTDSDSGDIRAQAYVIGHLHEEPRPGTTNVDRFGRLPWRMEVFPTQIDNFAAAAQIRQPTSSELARIQLTDESVLKDSFASIAGEPFVPKDWGGEKSDLSTTQLRLEGQQVVTAFTFKGRSKAKKMTVADLGKNGDQISRLFTEPCDLVVLQHCHEVTSAVRDHMRAFATRIGQLHLKPTVKKLGLPETVDFRSFRTMHSSLMSSVGVRPEVTRDNMGHSTVDVTQNVYNRTWWEERVEAVSLAAGSVWREFTPGEQSTRSM
jgi:hypothetical protein